MKKPVVLILLVVIIALLAGILTALNRTQGPESVLEKFETAYNSLDMDKMLDCLRPEISKPIKSMTALLGGVIGVDLNDVVSALPVLAWMTDAMVEDAHIGEQPRIHFDVIESNVDGNRATLLIDMTLTAGEQTQTERFEGGFVKIEGTWYMDDENGWD